MLPWPVLFRQPLLEADLPASLKLLVEQQICWMHGAQAKKRTACHRACGKSGTGIKGLVRYSWMYVPGKHMLYHGKMGPGWEAGKLKAR